MDAIRDFFEDNGWAKYVGVIGVILCLITGFTVPSIQQGNEIAVNETQIAANEAVMATDTELSDAVAPLATQADLEAVDGTLRTHLTAYALYILANDEAVAGNTSAITNIDKWINDFEIIWADFLEQYNGDIDDIYATMSSWYNYFYNTCCSELEE